MELQIYEKLEETNILELEVEKDLGNYVVHLVPLEDIQQQEKVDVEEDFDFQIGVYPII